MTLNHPCPRCGYHDAAIKPTEGEARCPNCAKAEALAGAASNLYEMLDESCVNGPEAHALAAALAAFREGK